MSKAEVTDSLLDALAEKLEISASRYASADRSYKAVSAWLSRPASRFAGVQVDVYIQGSFRLGTAIRPASAEENYDLDVICEFKLPKSSQTQARLQDSVGDELRLYAAAHQMAPPVRWNRCWTLHYSDEAQFRMDVVPSLPDTERQQLLLKSFRLDARLASTAVAITDSNNPNYRKISSEWPVSNPNGYANWFLERMQPILEMRRKAMQLDARASVANIPKYRIKTPLQSVIQVLKHHRNIRFADTPELRPSSVIITTLAAHAYGQEVSTSKAIVSVLSRMLQFVETRADGAWVANPSDPRENFADSWRSKPELKSAFEDWLETARIDFTGAATFPDPVRFVDALAPRMGRALVESALDKHKLTLASQPLVKRVGNALARIFDAPHRRPPAWPIAKQGVVQISSAVCHQPGFRPRRFTSGGAPLPKRASLTFEATTDVPPPYRVYWQVVNTGTEATDARNLRGTIEHSSVTRGHLTKEERTLFSGIHSVECFIVKDQLCVAQSGPFVVNID